MEPEEVITLQSYRWDSKFAVVVSRRNRDSVDKRDVFHYAAGEHKGLIVNKPLTSDITRDFENAMQIHVVCTVTDQQTDKTWTEIRRLLFNFRDGFSQESCKSAALDFHHDLLHPDIFKRDYCGFIITMMKIVQHRYPEIRNVFCGFEPLMAADNETGKAVLKHLEDCFPYSQTAEEITRAVGLDFNDVVNSLKNLFSQNLIDQVGNGYILRSGLPGNAKIDEETLSEYILTVLDNNRPNGLTLAEISDHVGYTVPQIEQVVSNLAKSNRIEYYDNLYYALSQPYCPNDQEIESVLELLESVHPNGMSMAGISEKICKRDITPLMDYLVAQGYVMLKDGLYFIRRLEDHEIDLVYGIIRSNNGLVADQIIRMSNLAEIVVVSCINLLEEKGDVVYVDDKYYVTEGDDETIKEALLKNYTGPVHAKTLAEATKISEERIAAVLSNMLMKGDLLSQSPGVYAVKEISDKLRERALKVIQNYESKNGIELEDLAPKIEESVFYTNLVVTSLINDKLAYKRGAKYFPTIKTLSTEEIPHAIVVRVYDAVSSAKINPKGNSAAEIARLVDIDLETSSEVLNYLVDSRLLVLRNGYYSKQSIPDVDCSAVSGVLCRERGLSVDEIARICPQFNHERVWFILRDLVAAKKVANVNNLYYKTQDLDEQRCTDSDIGRVLRALEGVSPAGLSIRDIAIKCRLSEAIVKKALSNLTYRCFVMARDDKYFARNFEDDCVEIISLLSSVYPNGLVLGEICTRVGIQSHPLVKEILRFLTDEQNSVELFGKLYFYCPSVSGRKASKYSVMRKDIIKLLAEAYPNGLNLQEIKTTCKLPITPSDLHQLVDERSLYEENGRFFYNQQFELTDNDYEQVLKVLEAAYPNSMTSRDLTKESKLSEENVVVILKSLIDQKQVTEVDKDVFIRSASLIEKSLNKGEVQNVLEPTIAILTSDYSVKVAADLMMTNITTYFKYKLGGDSSVYTLGNIGNRRVVATKFSHGYSQASAISAGNATTRLLGTFPRIEHVVILGLGGGVVETFDVTRHVRLGDVVVSYPGEENSIYFMATNFNFPRGELEEIGESTVTYTVKRWNCLDPELHSVVKKVYEETKDLSVFPWEEYISEGQTALSDDIASQDFHRPAQMTDPLSQKRGSRQSVLPKEFEGRPRMLLGTIGAGRHLHKIENLKEQFVERSKVIAFDAEYDQVTESIHGNCVDSFMFIHGISDYTDGTENELWQPYAALSAASVMRYFVENL